MANTFNIKGSSTGNYVQLANVVLPVYSKEILFAANPNLQFERACQKRTELSVIPGDTIKFLRYAKLTGGATIAESATVETTTMSTSTTSISVAEHVNAVGIGEFLTRASMDDVLSRAAQLLGQNYAIYRDGLIRDKFLESTNIIYANNKTSRAGLDSADRFDLDLIREAVTKLAINKCPKFEGGYYLCYIHPQQAKDVRNSAGFTNIKDYARPEDLISGEIGMVEDIRFIQTTQIPYIPSGTQNIFTDGADSGDDTAVAANSNTNVYRSVVCGDYAMGIADALPVEMRDDGINDFGRQLKLAWYGIFGVGPIESGHTFILETAGD